jgi:hypothetical protein
MFWSPDSKLVFAKARGAPANFSSEKAGARRTGTTSLPQKRKSLFALKNLKRGGPACGRPFGSQASSRTSAPGPFFFSDSMALTALAFCL